MSVREKAKELTKRRLKGYTEGRLGVVIDGTGHNFAKIKAEKKKMEHMGYDCFMVAVNTSLEVAKKKSDKSKSSSRRYIRKILARCTRQSWKIPNII